LFFPGSRREPARISFGEIISLDVHYDAVGDVERMPANKDVGVEPASDGAGRDAGQPGAGASE
jgi:hypothetical protein